MPVPGPYGMSTAPLGGLPRSPYLKHLERLYESLLLKETVVVFYHMIGWVEREVTR